MSFSSTVLGLSPVGYWKHDEASGSTSADFSGNGYDLTFSGETRGAAPLLADGSGGFSLDIGTFGTAIGTTAVSAPFNGTTGSYVGVIKTTTGTVCARDTGSGVDRTFQFRVDNSTGALRLIYWDVTGTQHTLISASGAVDVTTPSTAVVGFTVDTTTARLYVNGTQVASQASGGGLRSSAAAFASCSVNNGATKLRGWKDDEAWFGTALSATDMAALSDAAHGISTGTTGTLAGTLSALTGSLSAKVTDRGSLAGSLSALTGSLSAVTPRTGSLSGSLPALTGQLGGSSGTTLGHVVGTLPALTGDLSGIVTATGALAGTLPTLTGSLTADAGAPPSSALIAPVAINSRVFSALVGVTPSESPRAVAAIDIRSRVTFAPRPVGSPTTPHATRTIRRQAHLMPVLSAANPRVARGTYTVDRAEIGDLRLFVGGVDFTYWRGVPALFDRWGSEAPMGPTDATFRLPQMTPWDEAGVGELAALKRDAAVEVVLYRADGTVEHEWEGYIASDEDSSDEGSEDYTFHCEGTFSQAAHWPHDPPVVMDPIDPGYLVADLLNAVPNRRWAKIPRFMSGLTPVTDRGDQSQSVWQRVQDILAKAWTEDGRQLTLYRVGRYQYRVGFKSAVASASYTFTKGAPGVRARITRDFSQVRDVIFARGFAPDGGFWCNRFFPGLDFGVPPRYPMDNPATTLTGLSDADTDTGNGITVWQRRMRELGYAITVDGVMNPADAVWVRKVQRDAGLDLIDGVVGPQTWNATFETNMAEADLSTIRLPLVGKPEAMPLLYNANGSVRGPNPAADPAMILHGMPEVDWGSGRSKSDSVEPSQRMLGREGVAAYTAEFTVSTDPHEPGTSRLDITEGDNVDLLGHHGGVTFQVSSVTHGQTETSFTAASRAMDAMPLDAILARDRDAKRDIAARRGGYDRAKLNNSQVVPYEAESNAGYVSRTAVNGNVGLWSGRKLFVSQVGVAKIELEAGHPDAEFVAALFNRPIRISRLASLMPDPLSTDSGWYDNEEVLRDKYGLMEVFGTPDNPAGYYPRQKGKGPLTGRFVDTSSLLYSSPFGGFMWLYLFASRSTWIDGRIFPAVPQ